MALTSRGASFLDENKYGAADDAKAKAAAGGARRALGDIGNFVGSLTSRVAGKDGAKAGGLTARDGGANVQSLLGQIRDKRAAAAPTTRSRAREAGAGGEAPASTSSKLRSVAEGAGYADLPDIDAADRHDPLHATEYINDIHAYYRRVECKDAPPANYMSHQADVNDKMRAILIDWLVEVHLKFKLMPETLFLTVNLIDRYLAKVPVTRKNLQLVGVTAMLVASKYEEIWAPEVRDFVYISDKAYTRDQILATEKAMLNRLGFNLTVPTPFQFMSRYLKAAGADKRLEMAAFYCLELALPDYQFVKYAPSHLAAAALLVAMRTLGKATWTHALAKHSGYPEAALEACAREVAKVQQRAPQASLAAVLKKYGSPKYLEVAKLTPALGNNAA